MGDSITIANIHKFSCLSSDSQQIETAQKRLITFDNLIVLFNIKTLLLSETSFQLIYFLLKTDLPFVVL